MERTWSEPVLDDHDVHHHCVPVELFGQFACWTKPHLKVERHSYEVPTLSGMIGLLESIFWKPEMRWVVERIDVLSPIRFTTFSTNEYPNKPNIKKGPFIPSENRDIRANRVLRKPHYRVFCRPVVVDPDAHGVGSYISQFRRRVNRGAYFRSPYFGMREYRADFQPARIDVEPIKRTEDLGVVLLGINRENGHVLSAHVNMEGGVIRYEPEQHAMVWPEYEGVV